jgi:hypothetical protein
VGVTHASTTSTLVTRRGYGTHSGMAGAGLYTIWQPLFVFCLCACVCLRRKQRCLPAVKGVTGCQAAEGKTLVLCISSRKGGASSKASSGETGKRSEEHGERFQLTVLTQSFSICISPFFFDVLCSPYNSAPFVLSYSYLAVVSHSSSVGFL